MKHLNITVRGKVQGVWFRATTREQADNIGVRGFVKNQADGSVYLEAEGDEDQLNTLLAWLGEGPTQARVDTLESSEGEPKNFSDFSITR